MNEIILFDNNPDSDFYKNEVANYGTYTPEEAIAKSWNDFIAELKEIELNRKKPFGDIVSFYGECKKRYMNTYIEHDWLYRRIQTICCPREHIVGAPEECVVIKLGKDLAIEFTDRIEKTRVIIRAAKPAYRVQALARLSHMTFKEIKDTSQSLRDDLVKYYGE